jgi:hypothetical protein
MSHTTPFPALSAVNRTPAPGHLELVVCSALLSRSMACDLADVCALLGFFYATLYMM